MKQALIKLHISVFLAGFTGILGVLISLNEMSLVWYRIMITVVSLSVLFKITGKSAKIPKATLIRFLLIGCLIALHWVAFMGVLDYRMYLSDWSVFLQPDYLLHC